MVISLKTLTPLWTGGINKTADRLHTTGIIGSLRWWYEAILRGMGCNACDPTASPCKYDDEIYKKAIEKGISDSVALEQAKLCSACQVYGATGWARRFQLKFSGTKPLNFTKPINIIPQNHNHGWFLGAGLVGKLTVDMRGLYSESNKNALLIPLKLAMNWGAIGARVQHGYGVVGPTSVQSDDLQISTDAVNSLPTGARSRGKLPDLRDFFFAKLRFTITTPKWWEKADGLAPSAMESDDLTALGVWIQSGSVPVAPAFKSYLRFKNNLVSTTDQFKEKGVKNFLFGTTDTVCPNCYQKFIPIKSAPGTDKCRACHSSPNHSDLCKRVAAKINISCAYPVSAEKNLWEIRIWGWIPSTLPVNLGLKSMDRIVFLNKLKNLFDSSNKDLWLELLGSETTNHQLFDWRDFDMWCAQSKDDNPRNYLITLL